VESVKWAIERERAKFSRETVKFEIRPYIDTLEADIVRAEVQGFSDNPRVLYALAKKYPDAEFHHVGMSDRCFLSKYVIAAYEGNMQIVPDWTWATGRVDED
jgi:hypothetical protein